MIKLLTILIPTYNMQDYLPRCMDSLLIDEELMEQLDVIIVNDGSKDESSKIAHEYESKYPNTFRVIDKENGNYGSCINRGLKEASGKYIKVLDADDWFDNANFASFMRFLQTTEADLVLSDIEMIKPSEEVIHIFRYHLQPNEHTLRNNKVVRNVWMHAITYRMSIFDGLNYHQTEGISYTDCEWIFLPMTRVKSVESFPDVVYKYVIGREGQTLDPKVFMRQISQEIQGWKNNLSAWDATETTGRGDAEQYLWYRLILRANGIYRRNILGCFMGYSNQELKEFDNYIKSHNRKLYDELEYSTVANNTTVANRKIRFIHYWRKWHYCRPLVYLLLKIENKLVYLGNKYGKSK